MRLLCLILCIAVLAIGGAAMVFWRPVVSSDVLTKEAELAWADGDADRAERILTESLKLNPTHVPALLLAGKVAESRDRPVEALGFYRRLPADDARMARVFAPAGETALRLGRAADAEFFLRRAAALDPLHLEAHRALAALYNAEGRRWEAQPHLWQLVRLRRFSLDELSFLGNLDDLQDSAETVAYFRDAVPADPVPLTGLGRLKLHQGLTDEAEKLFREVVAAAPEQLEAQANLGRILAEERRGEEFRRWHAQLPAGADDHPGIWLACAAFARWSGNGGGAIRCLWEAVRRDPSSRTGNYQLAQVLAAEGEDHSAAVFARQAERLVRFENVVRSVQSGGPDASRMRTAAKLSEELGRFWEAWAWYTAILSHFPDEAGVIEEIARIEKELGPNVPLVSDASNPAIAIDLSRHPIPSWSRETGSDGSERVEGSATAVRFVDASGSAGMDFSYDNGATADGMKIFQTVGGGVGVIDYDLDGWPDLYFPQAGPWPPRPDRPYISRLFRNAGDGRFLDVTAETGLGDAGYGLGVAVGDYNNDGWPDLYAASIGPNHLYRNNADGTFSDVTDDAGIFGDQWTSCGLIADLSGDGYPDLYDVNYCAGREVFEKTCNNSVIGAERTCMPTQFRAEPDRIYLGRGDGTFEDATERSGLLETEGRGLGIVAFDPGGSGRPNLFVANDITANFYWVNVAPPGGEPRFEEQGIASGLAFDFDGLAQACMGVAADDADGDGALDLFVTNFFNESNALYLQRSPDLFEDSARQAGLRQPSLKMLGFGTQFLDADLDSRPDLVVANGHIDDYTKLGRPFRMRPQIFRNLGGRFEELPPERSGSYFQKERLGRGLARLDWNRDGREDFAVSHLFEPASLVTNETSGTGRALSVRLSTGVGSRDAIGASVSVNAPDLDLTKQMTAGDGYQSSNQRHLVFGLGATAGPLEVRVRWPSGLHQVFTGVGAGQAVLAVEGRKRLIRLPGPERSAALKNVASAEGR